MLNQGLTEEELELLLAPVSETASNRGFIHKLTTQLRRCPIVKIITPDHRHDKAASSPSSNQGE